MGFLRRKITILGVALFWVFGSMSALSQNVVEYSPLALLGIVDSGEPYLLDFSAAWCGTCKTQEGVLDELQKQNSAYNEIVIVRVDWDKYRSGWLVDAMKIPRRTTLVIMLKEVELGRLVAQTEKTEIAALLDLAL